MGKRQLRIEFSDPRDGPNGGGLKITIDADKATPEHYAMFDETRAAFLAAWDRMVAARRQPKVTA